MSSAIDYRSPTQVQVYGLLAPESQVQGDSGGAEAHEGLAPVHDQINSLR